MYITMNVLMNVKKYNREKFDSDIDFYKEAYYIATDKIEKETNLYPQGYIEELSGEYGPDGLIDGKKQPQDIREKAGDYYREHIKGLIEEAGKILNIASHSDNVEKDLLEHLQTIDGYTLFTHIRQVSGQIDIKLDKIFIDENSNIRVGPSTYQLRDIEEYPENYICFEIGCEIE